MKPVYLFVLLITFILTKAYSQTPDPEADSAFTEIKKLTAKWYTAIKKRDSLTLEKILAKEYTVNGTWPRDKWMNNIMHHFTMDSFEIAVPPKMTYFGDAVLSEGMLYWKGNNDGKPFMNAEFIVSDVWVYRDDRWQIHMRLLNLSKKR